jgi:uncharacterized protein YecT (DUF1311 family)
MTKTAFCILFGDGPRRCQVPHRTPSLKQVPYSLGVITEEIVRSLSWIVVAMCLASSKPQAMEAFSAVIDNDVSEVATRKANAAKLEACLRKRQARPESCLFLLALPCRKKARDNHGEAACYRTESDAWSTVLDAYQLKAEEYLGDEQNKLDELRGSHKAWLEYREKACSFIYSFIDGSMSVPLTSACEARESARRAMYLRQLLDYADLLE